MADKPLYDFLHHIREVNIKTFSYGIIIIIISNIIFIPNTLGMLALKTSKDLYGESDVIVIGIITSALGRPSERITDYTLSADKYLKDDLHQLNLHIYGIGKSNSSLMVEDEPIFNVGNRVILYLTNTIKGYEISPYSHILP
jgi:hypothetical protein